LFSFYFVLKLLRRPSGYSTAQIATRRWLHQQLMHLLVKFRPTETADSVWISKFKNEIDFRSTIFFWWRFPFFDFLGKYSWKILIHRNWKWTP
jgi:hypothetical protein